MPLSPVALVALPALLLVTVACGREVDVAPRGADRVGRQPVPAVCAGVACGEHASCEADGGVAACRCDEGHRSAPAGCVADGTGPADDVPGDDVPADDVPADDVPADDVPADDVPADEVPADDVPADDAPTAGSGGSGGGTGTVAGPCLDCLVHVPPARSPTRPMPLLVALHGDEGRDFGRAAATQGVIGLWGAAADAEGFLVLAVACPASEGCNGAWSDWLAAENYDLSPSIVSWLDAQVDAVEQLYDVDVSRVALAGHSGGAYWLGSFAQGRAARYSGVAFVAGGMPAYTAFHACPTVKIPGYFLGGDGDFRTQQMSDTANAYATCGQEITTDLIAGGTHQSTISSLSSGKAATIMAWLKDRPLSP